MRVIYITSTYPFGAAEPFLYPEIAALRSLGVDLKIIPMYPRGALIHSEAQALLPLVEAEPLFSWRILRSALKMFLLFPGRALRSLSLLLTPNPRHLLKNLAVFPKGLWLAELAVTWKAKHIHAHWAAATSSMSMVASQMSGVPWSLTAYRWDVLEDNLLRRKALHARFFRCISEKTKAMALERGVPLEKVRVLYSGVFIPEGVEIASRSEDLLKKFILLCPAFFLPRKGHRYLIEALALLPEYVELWLAGEGPLRPDLEAQVENLALGKRVRFLGVLPHEELLNLYRTRQVDAVVLASVDLGEGLSEGMPLALIEAMAFGYPVVATATGGIPELLRDGAGLLVPDKSPQALAEAIMRLIQDVRLREEVSRKGRLRVQEELAADKVARTLVELWREEDA